VNLRRPWQTMRMAPCFPGSGGQFLHQGKIRSRLNVPEAYRPHGRLRPRRGSSLSAPRGTILGASSGDGRRGVSLPKSRPSRRRSPYQDQQHSVGWMAPRPDSAGTIECDRAGRRLKLCAPGCPMADAKPSSTIRRCINGARPCSRFAGMTADYLAILKSTVGRRSARSEAAEP
jgi:hypothetical protein